MLKQALLYFTASVMVVFFAKYMYWLINSIYLLFINISIHLSPYFHALGLHVLGTKICLLMLIPLAIASVPALIYRGVTGQHMAYFVEMTWISWLILLFCTMLIR